MLIFVSCETEEKKIIRRPDEKIRTTLRINLNENILTLNPALIGTRSEKFLGYLLYEGLYAINEQGKTVPTLLKQHKMDTFNLTHFFKIKPRIALHNGEILNSHHIYTRFKEIIDSEQKNKKSVIESFRKNIKGYKKYLLHKQYKIGNDSLPSGFKIVDKNSFSIQFTQPVPDLVTILSLQEFWIYHTTEGNNYVGTGMYKLDYTNEDISYSLIKNTNYHALSKGGLDRINIRFIKNNQGKTDEFLNGSLDILVNSSNVELTKKLSNTKYGKYKFSESSLVRAKHLSIHNISNSDLRSLIAHLIQLGKENSLMSYSYNNETKFQLISSSLDSISFYAKKLYLNDSTSKIKLPVYLNCDSTCNEEFQTIMEKMSEYFEVYEVNASQLNPNLPYLVIEESEFHIYSKKPNKNTLKEVLNKVKKHISFNQSALILDYQRESIYANVMLKGLNPYSNWERNLHNLYFTQPTVLN